MWYLIESEKGERIATVNTSGLSVDKAIVYGYDARPDSVETMTVIKSEESLKSIIGDIGDGALVPAIIATVLMIAKGPDVFKDNVWEFSVR